MGVVMEAPDVYYVPSGDTMMIGYFLILAISMFAFVPLVAFRSLAAELDEGTYEMLAITRLSAWRIVSGKMNSAILQMLIYFAAIVPCLAFCYLLRGIGLSTIALSIAIVFATAMVLTSMGLVLSTLAKGRTLQTFLLVGLVAFIVFVLFYTCGMVFSFVLPGRWSGTWFGFASSFAVAGSFVVLFLAAAAARIAPMTENRSTRLRGILFAQQVIWVVTMSYAAWATRDFEWINLGLIFLGIFWLFVGVFMIGESNVISPRVRRDLPSTYASRALLTWWMPGPGTGFMYVVSTGMSGMMVLATVGYLGVQLGLDANINTRPSVVAAMMIGYVVGYLGLIRLLSLPLLARFGPSFAVPLVITVLVLFAGTIGPMVVEVALVGEVGDYSVMHASNWIWTWVEVFDTGGLGFDVGVLIYAVGLFILAINLVLLFREFRLRRIAVPRRVLEDREASQADAVQAS